MRGEGGPEIFGTEEDAACEAWPNTCDMLTHGCASGDAFLVNEFVKVM